MPPEHLLSGVGSGDYFLVGERALELLEQLVHVRAGDRVLDVGCGLGRLAWPLAGKLRRRGSYDGLDVVQAYTDWCAQNLGLDPARFRFHHANVRTTLYNAQGAIEAPEFRFPWPDRSFDLAIATSLFTHLLPAAIDHYLREIARTLDRGGRLFASFFLLDEAAREGLAAGTTNPTFSVSIEHGRVHDPAVPESAVACDPEWLFECFATSGLKVTSVHSGHWKGRPGFEYQDLVVAARMS